MRKIKHFWRRNKDTIKDYTIYTVSFVAFITMLTNLYLGDYKDALSNLLVIMLLASTLLNNSYKEMLDKSIDQKLKLQRRVDELWRENDRMRKKLQEALKPEWNESRIDIIAQNGNDGLHYEETEQ